MDSIKKIMVALAFSPYSEEIFNYAEQIAQALGAELVVASIVNERDISAVGMITAMGYNVDSEHYAEDIKKERQKMLDGFLEKSPFDREKLRVIIAVGNPIDELLKLTVKEGIDLVVMGIKGRTDLEHVFVGSVADKLFRRSPVPVISYRDKKSADRLKKRIK